MLSTLICNSWMNSDPKIITAVSWFKQMTGFQKTSIVHNGASYAIPCWILLLAIYVGVGIWVFEMICGSATNLGMCIGHFEFEPTLIIKEYCI